MLKLRLAQLYRILLYTLPAVLFFSYYPIIPLGSNSSMNFELSLPLLWLIAFNFISLLALLSLAPKRSKLSTQRSQSTRRPTAKHHPWLTDLTLSISDRRIFLFTLFPFYATLSAFWSTNPLRALLTAGIIWLIFFAVFSILYIRPLLPTPKPSQPSTTPRSKPLTLDKTDKLCYNEPNPSSRADFPFPKPTKIIPAVLFISTSAVCLFCFLQSILDLIGLNRDATLLCAGCTYRSFGFPHPSGFAIEPQFMGNLLLAPTLLALYLLTFRYNAPISLRHNSSTTHSRPKSSLLAFLALFFSTTLFFTFSRGAIYGFAVGLATLIVFALIKHHFRPALLVIPVVAFCFSLGLQGTFATLGPTSETFTSAITKSIHHLSLGLIDLRTSPNNATAPSALSTPSLTPSNLDLDALIGPTCEEAFAPSCPPTGNDAAFDGYVAESTNYRLFLSDLALRTWSSTPTNLIFGVGLGGAGVAMNRYDPAALPSPKEIVQNEPVSLLLELGLIGALLLIFELLLAFLPQIFTPRFLDGRATSNLKLSPKSHTTNARNTPTSASPKTSTAPSPLPPKALLRLSAPSPFWQHPALPFLLALILAYLVTLQFFSGLPNALHIYLLPPLLCSILSIPTKSPQPSKIQKIPQKSP